MPSLAQYNNTWDICKSAEEIYLDTGNINYFCYVIDEFAKTRKPTMPSPNQKPQ